MECDSSDGCCYLIPEWRARRRTGDNLSMRVMCAWQGAYGVQIENVDNKMLGRAQDPRANGTWLNKLNMKCLS